MTRNVLNVRDLNRIVNNWLAMRTTNNNTVYQEPRRLLKVQDVAFRLGIAKKTISNELSKGCFPLKAKRYGRRLLFDSHDVEKFIEKLPYANNSLFVSLKLIVVITDSYKKSDKTV